MANLKQIRLQTYKTMKFVFTKARTFEYVYPKRKYARKKFAVKCVATFVILFLIGRIMSAIHSAHSHRKSAHLWSLISKFDCNDEQLGEDTVDHFYLQDQAQDERYPYVLRANNPFIISNPGLCYEDENLDLLIIINSIPNNRKKRDLIRATWGNTSWQGYRKYGNFKIIFLLAESRSRRTQRYLHAEAEKEGDILQGRFPVSRTNSPQKGILWMRWAAEYCHKAKLVINTFDDMYLNIAELLQRYIPKYSCKKKLLMCHFEKDNIAIPSGKGTSGNHNIVPVSKYCNSFMVIMTRDMMTSLYHAARKIKTVWSDNRYIYGMLPAHVKGSNYEDFRHFSLSAPKALLCYMKHGKRCPLVAVKADTQKYMEKLWHKINSINGL